MRPPRLAEWLLIIFLKAENCNHRLGDFEEVFQYTAQENGWLTAYKWYWLQVICSIPEFINLSFYWSMAMLKNYLTIALRTLNNHKTYSFINIAGVAISIAACFLILKYVSFELSYDGFHKNANNLYRLTNDRYQNGELIQHGVITYPSVAKTMYSDYPEVLNFTRVTQFIRMYMQRDEIGFDENIVFADSAFFSMFSFPLLIGDAKTALAAPYSILLSESFAQKYFGNNWREDGVLGKVLRVDNRYDLTVTAVFENIPANSHLKFDLLTSWSTLGKEYNENYEDSWTNSNFMGYLQLAPGTDSKVLEQKFVDFSKRHFKGAEVTGYLESFYLQPLQDIHLYSDYEYDETWIHGNGTVVIALLLIAAFILIITWVNYVNLSTARSMDRAKEIGVRKVLGARRAQIVKQFLFESILINALGFLVAVGIIQLLQPIFSNLLTVQFSSALFTNSLGVGFLALFVTGTIVSGLYPAFLTSSFMPISVLKGKFTRSGRGRLIRKGLVIFQFALSFALVAGTYVVYLQINYMMDKDLGMNINQTLVLNGPHLSRFDSTYYNNIHSFKTELLRFPEISHVTTSQRVPGRGTGRIFNIQRKSGDSERRFTSRDIGVDCDFFKTFEMKIVAGRGFDRTDHNLDYNAVRSVVVNVSATKLLGFDKPGDAFLQEISFWGKDWQIVGVVTDHHHQSLHVPVEPIIFTPLYSTSNYFYVKVNTHNLPQTILTVEDKYSEFFPGNSFSYFFLDEFFNLQYQVDQNFITAFSLFASLGVLLACLGLFGLSFFTTAQRTKEIGIRKVIGATTGNILVLLVKDFSKLVLLAALLASPITYFVFNQWLTGYAYHIKISWTMLAIPGLIVLTVAIFTVSYQTIKAALLNPVEPLKCE